MVLEAEIAKKYFGDENPVGKSLTFWDNASARVVDNRAFNGKLFELTVTGVIEEPPYKSNLNFDFLASFSTFGETYKNEMWSGGPRTYLLLDEGASPSQLEAKLPTFVQKHLGDSLERAGQETRLFLAPLTQVRQYMIGGGDPTLGRVFIGVLSALALIILLIGGINFMNLATARSTHRAKEIGLRKVVGAERRQLVRQFLGESTLFALAALPIALLLVDVALPYFNALTGADLALNFVQDFRLATGVLGIILIAGLISGTYPALFMSRFRAATVLKGSGTAGRKSGVYRFLVVVQFALSIIMLSAIVVLDKQLTFARSQELGFDKDQIIVIQNWRKDFVEKQYAAFRNSVLQNPNVLSTSVTSQYPGYAAGTGHYTRDGDDDRVKVDRLWGDHDFVRTFGFELVAGRDFSKDYATDAEEAIILNEVAVTRFGWASPSEAIGQSLLEGDRSFRVIGVVEDFHVFALSREIGATVVRLVEPERLSDSWYNYVVAVKARPDRLAATVADLGQTWQSMFPDRPFVYSTLEDQIAQFYQEEEIAGQVFGAVSMIAIILACLGLFGLSAFAAERRTKEIGVRKVLGAKVTTIAGMLSKEFLKLVLIANLIAWPIAYFALSQFLQLYAYRIELGWSTFLLVGAATMAIALLTVSSQTIKAATANPVEALRYE